MVEHLKGRNFLFGFALVCSAFITTVAVSQSRDNRAIELSRLANEMEVQSQVKSLRVKEYAERNNVPVSYRDNRGNLVIMTDVADGVPVYYTTDNAGAAITTGVTKLREGGGLGLNLEGEGLAVGIWDGGSVNHNEYKDRVSGGQGTEDNHASHVTGTIAASGLNSDAKGMAPKATIYSFDFGNDVSEMLTLTKPDQSSILLSNHSYGLITGWNFNGSGWDWLGGGDSEDYRFGFYSSKARTWDDIAFNAPYYSIIKSAGNDRNDIGNGTRPRDCNGGSGYDCISDAGNAKNIITVGAVSKVTSYSGPSSVTMSSFSSWGPTDDGRIKPDIVAAGVGLFSSITNNSYGVLSGTSMSAPNTTGSLVLLQELHKNLHGGNFMKASTLKALAIHSAKEAGLNPGPDYRFGWGLLDVEAGAKLLLNENDKNIKIEELTLLQGQVFEVDLKPVRNKKITATIVWTDPAGNPVVASVDPTDRMLVNDLDIRIVDDANNQQFPWILDPLNPDAQAVHGDNVLDNVEKIEFDLPDPRNYKLVVSHKGTLIGGSQDFSLILEYTLLNDDRNTYYWIGGASGNWSDPTRWSLTSGGVAANAVPTINDRVFIDENSFTLNDQNIDISGDIACGSLTWLSDVVASIELNGSTLTIDGDLFVKNASMAAGSSGTILFDAQTDSEHSINFGGSNLLNVNLVFQGQNVSWVLENVSEIGGIILNEGHLNISDVSCQLNKIVSTGLLNRTLDLHNSSFSDVSEINLSGSGLSLVSQGVQISLSETKSALVYIDGFTFDGQLISSVSQSVSIDGVSAYEYFEVKNIANILEDITVHNIKVNAGSSLVIGSGKTLKLRMNTILESVPGNRIEILSDFNGKANILFEDYTKLCFDNLVITDIDMLGTAVVSVGENSVVTNSNNWVQKECSEVLFAKFSTSFSCVGSLTEFKDGSSGAIQSWNWNFGDTGSDSNTSNFANPYHVYTDAGSYQAFLSISNDLGSRVYTRQVDVIENNLPDNHVVLSNEKLFSFKDAARYQWFFNDELVEDATQRSYDFQGVPGNYYVVIYGDNCNRVSTEYIVTDVFEENFEAMDQKVSVYPNPAKGVINVNLSPKMSSVRLSLYDAFGKKLVEIESTESETVLFTSSLENGMYFLHVITNGIRIVRKISVVK